MEQNRKKQVLLSGIISAILAGAFFLFVSYYYKIFPFDDDYCSLAGDLIHQYCPMLIYFYDAVKSGSVDLSYCWNVGLGYSFLGNFFNYLASPFNLIIFLFGRDDIVQAVNIIIMLKSMTIAAAFSCYLSKSHGLTGAFNIIPSLLYTFSGWFAAYYWNIMWLDAVFCLPLAVVGLQRIIDGKKPWAYAAVLAYAMIVNYYTAYMLCIFLCIYFVYYYCLKNNIKTDFANGFFKSNLFKSGITFAAFSVLSALLSAVVLVPVYYTLKASSAVTDSLSDGLGTYFNVLRFAVQQFSGSSAIINLGGQTEIPNCWAGMLTVILVPAFLLSKQFSKKERILDALLLLLMFLSLNVNALAFVWCGFHYPNGLADRYAFFYVFVAVTIMAKALNSIDKISKPLVLSLAALSVVFISVMRRFDPEHTEKVALLVSIGFVVLWAAVYLISNTKKLDKALLKGVAVFVLCLELVFSQLENFDFNFSRDNFGKYVDYVSNTYDRVRKEDSELFFRTEASETQAYFYPVIAGYWGVSNSSSMSSLALTKSQAALGVDSNAANNLLYFPQTPVYNALFGVKYLIGNSKTWAENNSFEKYEEVDGFSAYRNKYYLPLAYCVDNDTVNFESEKDSNPFLTQNELFTAMSRAEAPFDYCELQSIGTENLSYETVSKDVSKHTETYRAKLVNAEETGYIIFNYVLPHDGECYVYISHERKKRGTTVSISGEEYDYTKSVSNYFVEPKGICFFGERREGELLTVKIPINEKTAKKDISVYAAVLNKNNFIEGYNKLKESTMTLTEFGSTSFKGIVNAEEDSLLFTSVPYDRGWSVVLDGRELLENEITAVDGAYISVPVLKGENTLEFSYTPYGLKTGAVISAVSAACLIAAFIYEKKKNGRQQTS